MTETIRSSVQNLNESVWFILLSRASMIFSSGIAIPVGGVLLWQTYDTLIDLRRFQFETAVRIEQAAQLRAEDRAARLERWAAQYDVDKRQWDIINALTRNNPLGGPR